MDSINKHHKSFEVTLLNGLLTFDEELMNADV